MLKSLLRELTRGFAREGTSAAVEEPPTDPLKTWRERRADANAAERAVLLAQLAEDPLVRTADVDALCLLADWQLAAGELAAAETTYRQALQAQPLHARALEGLGLSLLQAGRLEEAFLRLETASRQDPYNAEIWVHWGLVDLELGNIDRAAKKFGRAVDLAATNPHAWHNLALANLKLGKTELCLQQFRQAILLKPDHGLAHSNLALALLQFGDVSQALDAARRATELKTGNARVWVVLADVLLGAGQFEEARQSLEEARRVDPQHVGAYIGLGKLHAACARYEEAHRSYDDALRLAPDHAEALSGKGQLSLLLQDWDRGWSGYESRRRAALSPVRNLPLDEWNGEEDRSQHVLVHAEQGLGDIILFGSCIPDVLARQGTCTIEVPERLAALFRRSFPAATVLAHELQDTSLEWLAAASDATRHVPIGSLPRLFRRQPADFPRHPGYLQADPNRVDEWRRRLDDSPTSRPFKVGLAWRGGLAMTGRRERSIDLTALVRRLDGLDVQFVCLQYGAVDDDLEVVRRQIGREFHPGLSGYGDLDDCASLTRACDAVITVCSTQAHLTGALGHPGAVLVPMAPSWRYGASGSSMPWYPSLTLLRQTDPGNWTDVLDDLHHWLLARLAATPLPSC